MTISRRSFLAAHAAAAGALAAPFAALASGTPKKKAADPRTVKTGGAQAIPIDGGKYRVWVKKVARARGAHVQAHQCEGLRDPAGPERVRRQRHVQGLG